MTIDTAPADFAFCPRCATSLETKQFSDNLRRICPACGYIHFTDPKVGVGVLVQQAGRILLVRRKMNPERGKWSVPAGFVDSGEDPRETAVRETLEETNLHVAITGLVEVYFNPPHSGFASSIFIMFRAELLGGEMQAGDDADAVGFFALDELPELAFASTKDVLKQLKKQTRL